MKALSLGCALFVAAIGTGQVNPFGLESADAFFASASFAEAEMAYAEIAAKEPENFRAASRLGSLALFCNRLDEAEKWLKKATQLVPKENSAKLLLAEVYHRQDKFDLAALLLRSAGKTSEAAMLESFKGQTPYELHAKVDKAVLQFIATDPLPLVQVRVNGKAEATFLIDTGAPEVTLDPDFAKQMGVKDFGSATGTYAGGKTANYQYGRIDSLTLGDFEVKNLPVHLLNTRRFAPMFGGKQIDGVLGTVLFYHFLTTLDYPRGELVLRKNSEENQKLLTKDQSAITVPIWMAGDHFVVAWGKIEQLPTLFFVDTGLAGGGVTCSESVLKAAGIKLDEKMAAMGLGGGGEVRVVPFMVKELSLGDAKEKDIRGLFAGPLPMENAFGFQIGGIISHGFFKPYALTFDFTGMRLVLQKRT